MKIEYILKKLRNIFQKYSNHATSECLRSRLIGDQCASTLKLLIFFSLNIFGISDQSYAKKFATILQLILTKSHYFALSVNNLNSAKFVPKKDYASNRLMSGLLQLSNGTHLILDETVMNNGQLNSEGIANLTSLGNLIKYQNVEYDFGFHKLPFEMDVPCLIFSEGRSMLPQDVQIKVKKFNHYTAECFARFCFVVKTSADKMILQIFDIFLHDFSLLSSQLSF